jgi:hypothetical protein
MMRTVLNPYIILAGIMFATISQKELSLFNLDT